MTTRNDSLVTIHMAASLDGFIARKDGRVDWMEVDDEFDDGESMDPEYVEEFLQSIDCYVMGSRTYETALAFHENGQGWAYGDKPTFVLTTRVLPRLKDSIEFVSEDLVELIGNRLRKRYRSIWVAGGGQVAGECLKAGLADEIRYSIMPVLIGDGVEFFEGLERDVALHLREVKAYNTGLVALRYDVNK